jgi:hypothetical protein
MEPYGEFHISKGLAMTADKIEIEMEMEIE